MMTRLLSPGFPSCHEKDSDPPVLVAVVTKLLGAGGGAGKLTLVPVNSKSVKTASRVTVLKDAWAMPTCRATPVQSFRIRFPPARLFVSWIQASPEFVLV